MQVGGGNRHNPVVNDTQHHLLAIEHLRFGNATGCKSYVLVTICSFCEEPTAQAGQKPLEPSHVRKDILPPIRKTEP